MFGWAFGVAVWLGAHVVMVPALGLADPPMRQPLGKEAEELGLHLAYGSTTELVRRMLHVVLFASNRSRLADAARRYRIPMTVIGRGYTWSSRWMGRSTD